MRHASGLERCSIVAAGLETTCTLGRYAIVFAGDAYVSDAESCLEVRAYGRYKDDKGVLKKQEISVGATVDSGYSVIVKGGLSEDDLIAFPYGKDVKEGAKTKEVTLDQMYGY